MRVAAVARDRVDRLDVLRAELEQHLHRRRDDLALAHARAEHPVDRLVGRVDDPGRLVEQRELVGALDLARVEHHRLRVGDLEALALQREQRRHVGHVHPDAARASRPRSWSSVQIISASASGHAGRVGHRAAHRRHPGAPDRLRQPRAVELVVPRGRAEVPEDRVVVAEHEREADVLVALPRPDRRARDVAQVVRVEEQQAAELGRRQRLPSPARAGGRAGGRNRPAAPSRPPSSRRATRCWSRQPCRSPASFGVCLCAADVFAARTSSAMKSSLRVPVRRTRSRAARRSSAVSGSSTPRCVGEVEHELDVLAIIAVVNVAE